MRSLWMLNIAALAAGLLAEAAVYARDVEYQPPKPIQEGRKRFDPDATGQRTLFAEVFKESPQGHVIWLTDLKGTVLGSAVRVCPPGDTSGRSDWYITASHVVEPVRAGGVFSPESGSLALTAELPSGDFALLRGGSPRPCAKVASRLRLPVSSEAETLVVVPGEAPRFSAEAWDKESGTIRRSGHTLPLALTPYQGFPGREDTGRLLTFGLRVPLGSSGGGLFYNGELIAMLLATELTGYQTVALAGPVIHEILRKAQEGDPRLSVRSPFLHSIAHGAHYSSLSATHQRSFSPRQDSGTGRLVDSGSGRLVDTRRGLTGSPSEGGLLYKGRRWLSHKNVWSEGERLPGEVRSLLRQSAELDGVFVENGKFYLSSKETPLPEWMRGLGRTVDVARGDITNKCTALPAAVNGPSTEIILPGRIYVCEFADSRIRELRIAVNHNDPDFKALLFRVLIEKSCEGQAAGPCPLYVQAQKAVFPYPRPLPELLITSTIDREGNNEGSTWIADDPAADLDYWMDQALWMINERQPLTDVPVTSLRALELDGFSIAIDTYGSLRLVVRGEKKTFEFKAEIPQPQDTNVEDGQSVEQLLQDSVLLQ